MMRSVDTMSQSSVVPAYKDPIFKVKRPAMRYPKTLSTSNESLIQAFEAAKKPSKFPPLSRC